MKCHSFCSFHLDMTLTLSHWILRNRKGSSQLKQFKNGIPESHTDRRTLSDAHDSKHYLSTHADGNDTMRLTSRRAWPGHEHSKPRTSWVWSPAPWRPNPPLIPCPAMYEGIEKTLKFIYNSCGMLRRTRNWHLGHRSPLSHSLSSLIQMSLNGSNALNFF